MLTAFQPPRGRQPALPERARGGRSPGCGPSGSCRSAAARFRRQVTAVPPSPSEAPDQRASQPAHRRDQPAEDLYRPPAILDLWFAALPVSGISYDWENGMFSGSAGSEGTRRQSSGGLAENAQRRVGCAASACRVSNDRPLLPFRILGVGPRFASGFASIAPPHTPVVAGTMVNAVKRF